MKDLFDVPKYYEIAFSYRDIQFQVNVFEESIKRYSKISVNKVLELGCGNSPHMSELVSRGYEYMGIDYNEEMIRYSEDKSRAHKDKVKLICANMFDFDFEIKVDFACILVDSLYIRNNDELNSHFDSVSKVLQKGGLYFLDWCVQFSPLTEKREDWKVKEDGVIINGEIYTTNINTVAQTYEENVILNVNDKGKLFKMKHRLMRKAIYPQEFLLFIENRGDFEFVGWWNNWNLDNPLKGTEKIYQPIIIIRKK